MPREHVGELRGKSDTELTSELEATQRELLNLRFREATRQLEKMEELGRVRKRIARIKTLRRERELGIE